MALAAVSLPVPGANTLFVCTAMLMLSRHSAATTNFQVVSTIDSPGSMVELE